MNVFQQDFFTRLKSWHDLRQSLTNSQINDICYTVDSFWQKVPLTNHYLHPDFLSEWPNPWELINDNMYCTYGRALGMIYTLLLLGIKDIDLVLAKDDNSEEVVLVTVNDAKYILNYWPDTVVNNSLDQFKIIKKFNITSLMAKI